MRLKVISVLDESGHRNTSVVDARTGEVLEQLAHVTWVHEDHRSLSELTLKVLDADAEIDFAPGPVPDRETRGLLAP